MCCGALDRAMRQEDGDGPGFSVSRQNFLAAQIWGPTETVVGGGGLRRCVEERGGQKCWDKFLRDLVRSGVEAAGNRWRDDPSNHHEFAPRWDHDKLGKRTMILIKIQAQGVDHTIAQFHANRSEERRV